ncbi:MAG: class I SAM-dependent methyltransferase [Bryobacteraceae bacterium]
MMPARFDFGYPWWLTWGHVTVLLPAAAAFLVGAARKWRKGQMLLLAALVLWSGASIVVTRLLFNVNSIPPLPAHGFFREGKGRVLDIGAGTGRSSIMVLNSRPQATLVALDLFGESFEHHFGRGQSPQAQLRANLRAAGVDHRATIETADMRKLPFESGTFDAIVSAYAMDHLNRRGIEQSLAEAARVVKPGGEFLLIVVANDPWAKFAFGPMLAHGGTHGPAWWTARLQEAGFQLLEEGTYPISRYLLARRP